MSEEETRQDVAPAEGEPEPAAPPADECPVAAEMQLMREAMEMANEAKSYEEKKGAAQRMKELLIKQTSVVASKAGSLKSQAKAVADSIEQKTKEQEDIRAAQSDIRNGLATLRTDSALTRREAKKQQLAEVQEQRKLAQEKTDRAIEAGKKPFERTDIGTRYVNFLVARGELLLKAAQIKGRYTSLKESEKVIKTASPDELLQEVRTTESNNIKFVMDLEKLQAEAAEMKGEGWHHEVSTQDLEAEYAAAKQALEAWKDLVNIEIRRATDLEKRTETFLKEQATLLSWCTTQQNALAGLSKSSDILEFCASLHGLVNTMEENIQVLQDMSEAHLPNTVITDALVDLNNAWVKLQVKSYETMLKTLMEQHSNSGLKEAVVKFAEWQRGELAELLDAAEELLSSPEQAREKELVAGQLELCKELQNEFQPHLILMEHLQDFEVRMDLIEDQYHPMLNTILSSLTALCQRIRLGNQTSFKGKQEYENFMTSLNDWIVARDTDTTAWEEAKEKVSNLCVRLEMP